MLQVLMDPAESPRQENSQSPKNTTTFFAWKDMKRVVRFEGSVILGAMPKQQWILLGVLLALLFGILLMGGDQGAKGPGAHYVPIYTLVADTISKNGVIVINLPEGVNKEATSTSVLFDPEIDGSWIASELPDALVFKPRQALTVGNQYLASLTVEGGTISKPFSIDEDPMVSAIFPQDGAEADLQSAISITFNRPMVPLTALQELDAVTLPIQISPHTEGVYRWITTRTLQFIPKKSLIGSAHYTVSVNPGFVSVDGVAVSGKSASFTTKKLELVSKTEDTLIYNRPARLHFNQPVDLEALRNALVVEKTQTYENIPVELAYDTYEVTDPISKKKKKIRDERTVTIRPAASYYGMPGTWEISTSYRITVAKVISKGGGDIPLNGSFTSAAVQTVFTSSHLLSDVSASSPRTDLASATMFDPEGTLRLQFYDDIDLDRSDIRMKGLQKLEYGEKCAEQGRFGSAACSAKVADKKVVVVHVDKNAYALGESISLQFASLVNAEGFSVDNAYSVPVVIYKPLSLRAAMPKDGSSGASVKELIFCSNTPLKAMDRAAFQSSITSSGYMVFGRFNNSYPYYKNSWRSDPCSEGEFVTRINYGLHPEKTYTLSGNITDVFGQTASFSSRFVTEKVKRQLRYQALQKVYNVTTPEKTKLTFAVENFDYANVHICKVSPDTMVKILGEGVSDVDSVSPNSLSCVEEKTDTIRLKPDLWVNQYFQIQLSQYFEDVRGQFVVTVTHPQFLKDNRADEGDVQLYGKTYMSVTNLAVAAKNTRTYKYSEEVATSAALMQDVLGSLYWVIDQRSQKPVSGAAIRIFNRATWNTPAVLAVSGKTNELGLSSVSMVSNYVGASITSGEESAVVTDWADALSSSWSSSNLGDRLYVYTDRPIYRLGQEVYYKGIHRLELDQQFEVTEGRTVTVTIRNSNYEVVETQKVIVNDYGTIDGKIQLSESAPLGTYTISTNTGGYAQFAVAEYVGAAFEASAETDKEEYVAGDTATIDVSASYYFGSPVDGGVLEYAVSAQDFYFDRYTDGYFNFGSNWYYCYDCGYGDSFVTQGVADISTDGKAKIALPLDFEKYFTAETANKSKIFVLQGTVKDQQGRSVSFEKSFIVHRGLVYVGVRTDPSIAEANTSVAVALKTVNQQGVPVAQSGIEIVTKRISWSDAQRQEVDGGYYSRAEKVYTEVQRSRVSTDQSGSYTGSVLLTTPGQYEVQVSAKDSAGNLVSSTAHVYVVGAGSVDVRPTNNATLDLVSPKTDMAVGDTATIVIQSPYPKAKALVTLERGKILSYDIIDITESMTKYSFTVSEEHIPNVFASVVLLSPDPQVKYGALEFTVNTAQKELSIEVVSNKLAYLPGEDVTLTVATKDYLGRPIPASVSIAVADLSVLALKGNPKKNPLVFFYRGMPLAVTTMTNIKNILTEAEIPTGTKGGDGGDAALNKKQRGIFKDTAYWSANVITNAEGKALVTFTLPDNITRWQVESLGVTKDTRLGIAYNEVTAQKELMLVPLRPRFIVPGDEFMLGAKIFNETDTAQTLTVSLASPQLAIEDTADIRVTVPSGKTATAYFDVAAPADVIVGPHVFTLTARNDDYEDSVIQSIPITRNSTYESVATQHTTTDLVSRESLYLPKGLIRDQGGLTIRASATLLPLLSDGLAYFADYPYGCSEQVASKLAAIALSKRIEKLTGNKSLIPQKVQFEGEWYTLDEAVQKGLATVYAHITYEGGFGFYQGSEANVWLSMRVLDALIDLREAGYVVRGDVITRATTYLEKALPTLIKDRDEVVPKVVRVLARINQTSSAYQAALTYIRSLATDYTLANTLLTTTLADIAHIATRGVFDEAFKRKVFAALENRIAISGRGAYATPHSNVRSWSHLESAEEGTARALEAMIKNKSEYPFMDEMVRWLRTAQRKDASWGSTQASVATVKAMLDFSESKKEQDSHFTLEALLDGNSLAVRTFATSTLYAGDMVRAIPNRDIAEGVFHTLAFNKTNYGTAPNPYYYDAALTYYVPTENIGPRDEGITVSRALYSLKDAGRKVPLVEAKVGEVVRGVITITSPLIRKYVSIEDFIPAGFELVDFSLDTENASMLGEERAAEDPTYPRRAEKNSLTSNSLTMFLTSLRSGLLAAGSGAEYEGEEELDTPMAYGSLYVSHKEIHDDRVFLFIDALYPGSYQYEYYVRATTPGTYQHMPAVVSEMYHPEVFGRTAGASVSVVR